MLGGTGTSMIGNVIQSLYLQQRNYPEAAALSFVMMLAILVVVAGLPAARRHRRVHGRRGGEATR